MSLKYMKDTPPIIVIFVFAICFFWYYCVMREDIINLIKFILRRKTLKDVLWLIKNGTPIEEILEKTKSTELREYLKKEIDQYLNEEQEKQKEKKTMKGFIEVTSLETEEPVLINVQFIKTVKDNHIAVQEAVFLCYTQETYEEIKELIKKAME